MPWTHRMVFEIDRKQPGDAFANGSITLGLDLDLVQFISGRAVKDGKTSCTSTTEEHPDINAVCKKIARHSRYQIIYHYRKRPSLNFLNLEVSLQSAQAALQITSRDGNCTTSGAQLGTCAIDMGIHRRNSR